MKNKEYKGAANILNNQNIGKQFFDHMDFGDCQSRIDAVSYTHLTLPTKA